MTTEYDVNELISVILQISNEHELYFGDHRAHANGGGGWESYLLTNEII